MLLGFIRFARGTVEFEVKDGYLERFISLCGKSGVPLWNVRRQGTILYAKTSYAGSKRLREMAAKSGVTLHLARQGGVPPILKRYRLRVGVFMGLAALVILPLIMSSFLWRIDISGCIEIPEEDLRSSLSVLGVHVGVQRRAIDARAVERQMMLSEGRLSWIAVNLRGSTAHIEVRERDIAPPPVDKVTPHNIVASRGGFITNMMVYEGQPLVKNGDSVLAGDILVSGIMEDTNQKNRTVHARAKIEAQVSDSLSVTVPYTRTVYVCKGFTSRKRLNILSMSLPLGNGDTPPLPWKAETVEQHVPLLGSLMPIKLVRQNYILLEAVTERVTADEARLEAESQLEALEKRSFPEGSIVSRDVTGQELDNSFILFADYIRTFDIAEEHKILIQNTSELQE